jgi:hypothetical protein
LGKINRELARLKDRGEALRKKAKATFGEGTPLEIVAALEVEIREHGAKFV